MKDKTSEWGCDPLYSRYNDLCPLPKLTLSLIESNTNENKIL